MAVVNKENFITAIWKPGTATSQTLPTHFPDIGELIGAVLWDVASTTTVGTTALTVVKFGGTPTGAQITNADSNTITLGQASVADELLVITYRAA